MMKNIITINALLLAMTSVAYANTAATTTPAIPSLAAASQMKPPVQSKPFVDKKGFCLTVRQIGLDNKLSMPNKEELRIVNLMLQNPKASKATKTSLDNEMKVALKANNGKNIGIYEIKCAGK